MIRPCPTGRPEFAAPVVELERLEVEPVPFIVLPGNALLPGTVALPASEPALGAVLVESELLVEPGTVDVVPALAEPVAAPEVPDCANALAPAKPTATAAARYRIECRIKPPQVRSNRDRPREAASVLHPP